MAISTSKLLGATSSKFRCVRCKNLYRTQAKLLAHDCDDKSVSGILATLMNSGRRDEAVALVRASLASSAGPAKANV